jgi:hypothetical protein
MSRTIDANVVPRPQAVYNGLAMRRVVLVSRCARKRGLARPSIAVDEDVAARRVDCLFDLFQLALPSHQVLERLNRRRGADVFVQNALEIVARESPYGH